ncbi:hypothetical protein WJX82_010190 [Trebouxia sp. C0006]
MAHPLLLQYSKGHWQDRMCHSMLLIAWGVKQLVHTSELLTEAKWHDGKPCRLMLPGPSCTTFADACERGASHYLGEDYKAQPIILRLSSPDYITNAPGRSTGRVVFKSHLLAKQGRLVDIPQEMTSDVITVEQLAEYMEPILTAAAGGRSCGHHGIELLSKAGKQSALQTL